MKKTFCFSDLGNMKASTAPLFSNPFTIFTAVLFSPVASYLKQNE